MLPVPKASLTLVQDHEVWLFFPTLSPHPIENITMKLFLSIDFDASVWIHIVLSNDNWVKLQKHILKDLYYRYNSCIPSQNETRF